MAARPETARATVMRAARRRERLALGLLLLLAASLWIGQAAARTYRWVDENGKVHYSDQLPPEAVNRASTELSRQGVPIRRTEAALTPEQRKALEEEKARKREQARMEDEQRRMDRLLLDTYRDEKDIDRAQRRALIPIGRAILDAEARIAEIGVQRTKLDKEKLFYERRALPESLKQQYVRLDELERERRVFIETKSREALAVIERFDAERRRFRILQTDSGPKPSGRAG